MTAATPTRLDAQGKVLDGLSRATTLLREHRDLPAVSVVISPRGIVDLDVSAIYTYDEHARRAAVDAYAVAVHCPPAEVKAGKYATSNAHWIISTAVKHERCPNCGGAA